MSMKKVYIDFHVIQTAPPSCINRDDTGSPKTAIYGGVRRARVSSQAWKRAMREMFRGNEEKGVKGLLEERDLGQRTLLLFDLVADEIIKQQPEMKREKALGLAKDVLKKAKVEGKKSEDKVDALFFMGLKQAENLASLALGKAGKDTEKEILKILRENNAVDVALFGRMVASNPLLNTDASAQVAHSISTHKAENEYDYFTAVDDRSADDNAGAGMLGTVEYNSATLYRYATVAAHELFKQLANDETALEKAVNAFVCAFVTSMPTGKQNTFANRTLPDAVMVAIRTDQPVNLAGAFEEPVKAGEEGYVKKSAKKLAEYAKEIYGDFCNEPAKSYVIGACLAELGDRVTLPGLMEKLGREAAAMCKGEESPR
jgi:CRISPR system Cascade subunit CasC